VSPIRQASAATASGIDRVRTALSAEAPLEGLGEALCSTPFLATILLLTTWPLSLVLPQGGPDASWQAGLYLAVEHGLQFGRDFVFTYGPLGFLHAPVLYGESLFLLAFGFSTAVRFALALALLWTARRALPLPLALVACYVILVVGHLNSASMLVAFLLAFAALGPEPPRYASRLLALGGGFLAAVEVLGKINYGISTLALCLVALVALPGRRRNVASFAAVWAASLLGLWLAAGQDLANLPSYFANGMQIVAGYSRAMGIDVQPTPHEIALSLAVAAILAVGVLLAARGEARRNRWASLVLFLLFAFVCFKQDFIRRGPEGRADFSLMMAAAALAIGARIPARFALRRPRAGRARELSGALAAALLLAPAIALVVWANPATTFSMALEPGIHLTTASETAEKVFDPETRADALASSREAMHDGYAIPAPILARIGERTVAIEPWEIGVAWADDLNWKPLPVIQDYAVYAPALDHLNVAALNGDGPATILRRNLRGSEAGVLGNVDDRYPAWDGPGAKLALLCNYREAITSPQWQLVEQEHGRCGPPSPIGTVQTQTGSPVSVPAPPHPGNEIVFARIDGLQPNLTEDVETLLYRSPNAWVSFDARHRWNLAASTAGDGLILSAPAAIDYARPFQLAPNPRSFRVGIDGAGSRPLTVSFYSRRVEKSSRAATSRPPRATTAKR
jgi:hypothetical protein